MELKIATWNMDWNKNRKSSDNVWQHILDECGFKADIIFFQEGYQNELIKVPEQHLFKPSATCSGNNAWGTGVFVRAEVGKLESVDYPNVDIMCNAKTRPDKTVIGKLKMNNGLKIYLISTHIDSSKYSRKDFFYKNDDVIIDHIEEVFSIVAPIVSNNEFIMCGDFNADRSMGSEYVNLFRKIENNSYGNKFLEYQYINDKHETQTYFGKNMSVRNHYQDDHIFLSAGMAEKVNESFVGNYGKFMRFSDHAPIFMTINI